MANLSQQIKWLSEHEDGDVCKLTVQHGDLVNKEVCVVPVVAPCREHRGIIAMPRKAFGSVWKKRALDKEAVVSHKSFKMDTAIMTDGTPVPEADMDITLVQLAGDAVSGLELHEVGKPLDILFESTLAVGISYPEQAATLLMARENFLPEGYGTGRDGSSDTDAAMGARVDRIETDMNSMNETLKGIKLLLEKAQTEAPQAVPQSAVSQAAAPSSLPKATGGSASANTASPAISVPDDVAAEAEAIGITRDQLQHLGPLLRRAQRGLPTEAKVRPRSKANVLSESEDEDGDPRPEQEPLTEAAAIAQCLSKLTKVTTALAKPKTRKAKLEELLDGALSSRSPLDSDVSGSQSLSAARGAQAYLQLRSMLDNEEDARDLELKFEANMRIANTNSANSVKSDEKPCPLYYLEHRSRVTAHEGNLNWCWMTAQALKAAQAGNHHEVAARLYLMLAAGEQVALDSGSWALAWEYSLSDEVPWASFLAHNLQNSKFPHPKIVDARMHEILYSRVKSVDDAAERRKKLIASKRPYGGNQQQQPGDKEADAKGASKGKNK